MLVIGGTGMLGGVSLALAQQGNIVSVLARHPQSFTQTHPNLHPIAMDYHNTPLMLEGLSEARSKHGDIAQSVIWIHSTAPTASLAIAKFLSTQGKSVEYWHVLGSRYHDAKRLDENIAMFSTFLNIHYHAVILGFIKERNHSRWLTHEEISRGVLEAMQSPREKAIVGTLTPWEDRPA